MTKFFKNLREFWTTQATNEDKAEFISTLKGIFP
jgi:hypothetical protein